MGSLLPEASIAVLCVLAPLASSQIFVERAAEVGLVHKFESGLDRIGGLTGMVDWAQQGMGIGDLDGDGDNDLVAAGRMRRNSLWRNDGGVFSDVTLGSNVESSNFDGAVALGDYDRDGDLDLFLGVYNAGTGPLVGGNRLLRNEGNFAFTDVTELAGVQGLGHCLFAKFFDADRDGLLDIGAAEFALTGNRLWHNNGDGSFEDVSAATGFDHLGSTHIFGTADTDGDGNDDIMVGNDWVVSKQAQFDPLLDEAYLHGNGDGSFSDLTVGSGLLLEGAPLFEGASTMGLSYGDVDYDGDFDCYKTEIGTQYLMINRGWPGSGLPWTQAQTFFQVANKLCNSPTGLGPTVGWGCTFAHFNLDPWIDLFKINGHISAPNQPHQQNYMFLGDGPSNAFKFSDKTALVGLNDFYDDRGLAVGDVDRDGDLDLLIAPPAGNLRYFDNGVQSPVYSSVSVRIKALTSAPNGEGALVQWTDSQGYLHKYVMDADGQTASQNEKLVLLGIGAESAVDIQVQFPSGMTRTLVGVAPWSQLEVQEPELVRLSSRHLPAAQFKGSILPLIKPTELFFVNVAAHDASGAPVTELEQVAIAVPGMSALGAVQALGGNRFRRTFLLPSVPGEYRAEVSFAGFSPKVHPSVHCYGAANPERTSASCTPPGVRAQRGDAYRLTLVPKDANGITLGRGHTVLASMPGQFSGLLLEDQGDGRYTGLLQAPAAPGEYSIDAQVDGVSIADAVRLECAGAPSASASVLYIEKSNQSNSLNLNQAKLQLTPRDANGLRLGPGAQVSLVVQPNLGTQPVTLLDLGANNQDDGDFYFVFERPVGSPPNSAAGSYQFFVDGLLVKDQAYLF